MMIVFGSHTTAGQDVKDRVTTLSLVCTAACTAAVVVVLLGDACCRVGRAVRARHRSWRGVTAVGTGFGREGAGEARVTVRPQPEGSGRGRWGGAAPQAGQGGGGLLRAADAESQVSSSCVTSFIMLSCRNLCIHYASCRNLCIHYAELS